MEMSPEELAQRQVQMRPPQGKPDTQKPQPPRPTIKMVGTELTPQERARKALGLEPDEPTPELLHLSPELRKALEKLDPQSRAQVVAVMGCLQHFQEKTQALSHTISQRMSSATLRTQKTSLAQRAIIRRAKMGTLGVGDIEMARGIIDQQGASGAMDPQQIGLNQIQAQREELMGATQDMRRILIEHLPPTSDNGLNEAASALAFVDNAMGVQAASAAKTADETWGQYRQSDMERIQIILEGQRGAQMEGEAGPVRPQGR